MMVVRFGEYILANDFVQTNENLQGILISSEVGHGLPAIKTQYEFERIL